MESAEILHARLSRAHILHRREENLIDSWGLTQGRPPASRELIQRILAAYSGSDAMAAGHSMWTGFMRENEVMHAALLAGDIERVEQAFSDPGAHNLFKGFDNLYADFVTSMLADDGLKRWMALISYDSLIRLGEAVGAIRLDNPEQYGYETPSTRPVDEVLSAIDAKLGLELAFPSIYPNEIGVRSSRGIVGYRATQAVFQAYLIAKQVENVSRPRVLEIGAGLGRTAYYARQLGVMDYTIADLPFTNVSQAHFLGTLLGGDAITLGGEPERPGAIRIWTEKELMACGQRFDLIVNVDSFTEIDDAMQERYWDFIRRSTPRLLSINHEHNSRTVVSHVMQDGRVVRASREPYWMRRGYTQEIVEFAEGSSASLTAPSALTDKLRHSADLLLRRVPRPFNPGR